ncbi:hypothetical protein GCM10022217_16020 [Chryseobacterium ginsenosidimutans]|uniref:hypothetical protein n=1 Tax=Chryseobacterium ginsenosidimutans TaxID=687846 RepID=UPI0031E24544
MNLLFTEQLNGKPTCFIDKIWLGLGLSGEINYWSLLEYFHGYKSKFGKSFDQLKRPLKEDYKGKLHTIREDKNDVWHAGILIDFILENADNFRFAPRIPVISTQDVFMTKKGNDLEITIANVGSYIGDDDFYLWFDAKEKLAINDGFDSYDEFSEYFLLKINENGSKTGNYWYSGKIIHWTDFKYCERSLNQ